MRGSRLAVVSRTVDDLTGELTPSGPVTPEVEVPVVA